MPDYSGEFIVIECAYCSMPFGITKTFNNARKEDHKTIYCPAGHKLAYQFESKAEKYKRLYEKERKCCEIKAKKLKTARASFYGLKGHVAKLKKKLQVKGDNPCPTTP